ncbi:hypothetical protein GF361_03540 [Candidatus Woesearchaeota archaeon]|nr:hypothetical protein [Candidatus Woesearchaeota archaeon]
MTVINMMSFGDSGAAVADEQASNSLRKYNIAQKLRMIDDSVIYGGSGSSSFIKELYDNIINHIKKEGKKKILPEEIYGLCKYISTKMKHENINNLLNDNYGITYEEFKTGKVRGNKLDEKFKSSANNIINDNQKFLNVSVLLGGLCDNKFEIFYIDNCGGSINKNPGCYGTIGSGSDESSKVLSKYSAKLPREKRENKEIDKEEGLIKLIEATNASANLNIGVGGNPSIIYMDKDGIKQPDENQCILASEIVEGYTMGFLNKEFTYNAIENLVLNDTNFEDVEEKMKRSAKDWDKLDRVLRGYKI